MEITRAGLCVIDYRRKKMVILKKLEPYTKTYIYENFVEKYCLPRGKTIRKTEDLFHCALREFHEETTLLLIDNFEKYCDYFDLWWYDQNEKWIYRIFFVNVDFNLIVNSKKIIKFDIETNKNTILLNYTNKNFDRRYELHRTLFLSKNNYRNIISNRQRFCYEQSNYEEFLIFLEKVFLDYERDAVKFTRYKVCY